MATRIRYRTELITAGIKIEGAHHRKIKRAFKIVDGKLVIQYLLFGFSEQSSSVVACHDGETRQSDRNRGEEDREVLEKNLNEVPLDPSLWLHALRDSTEPRR
ncbi:hypothetical protein P8452_28382 [Trifolium repens]|nr:hypothetical protein P8452_28382 [Trifolium repens]